ncbi:hypothetical protein K2173_021860 [Erythroxylum novogranatense]|uniref:Thioredoxin domain-containing protein n=1 Tax=Erythroxylum novogranatense TaxID=1862640 RepID=A0AAV8T236_9ROSI|nr:hypothetical protein K2173_021860 [Erythroxylum novogranatense]
MEIASAGSISDAVVEPKPSSSMNLSEGIRPAVMYQSYFFMTTNGALNLEALKNPGEAKTDDGEKSRDSETEKPVRGGPISWLSLLLMFITRAGIIFYYDREKKRHIEEINKASQIVKEGPFAGKAAIGGPFNLINHDGKPVTEKDFVEKWMVMYFSFTRCPDIYLDELQKLVASIEKIKEKTGIEIVPVFIFVDPERDTVEQVREYCKEFHPKLVGLTGNLEEIKKAARAYRIYYMKIVEEDSDHLVDHSIVIYASLVTFILINS